MQLHHVRERLFFVNTVFASVTPISYRTNE